MPILSNLFEALGPLPSLRAIVALVVSLTAMPQASAPGNVAGLHVPPRLPLAGQVGRIDWANVPAFDSVGLASRSAIVVERTTGELMGAKAANLKLPLASLTKLATALELTEQGLALDNVVRVRPEDNSSLLASYAKQGDSVSRVALDDGDEVVLQDVLAASLVGSANNATMVAVRASGLDAKTFTAQVNQRLARLGLLSTRVVEPTGLKPQNVGTAFEVAVLADYVWSKPAIRELSALPSLRFLTVNGHEITATNTNELFRRAPNFKLIASKTGYLKEAGYNVALLVQIDNLGEYLVVLLGAPTAEARITDVGKLVSWLKS